MRLTISLQSQYSIFLLQIFSLDISRIPPTELKTVFFSYTDDDHAEYLQNQFYQLIINISVCCIQGDRFTCILPLNPFNNKFFDDYAPVCMSLIMQMKSRKNEEEGTNKSHNAIVVDSCNCSMYVLCILYRHKHIYVFPA